MKKIYGFLSRDFSNVDAPCILEVDSDINSLNGKELSILADLILLASSDSDLLHQLAEVHDISHTKLRHRLSDVLEKVTKSNSNEFFYDN